MNKYFLALLALCVLLAGPALADKNKRGIAFDERLVLKDADDTLISSTNKLSPVTSTAVYTQDFYLNSADLDLGVVVSCSAYEDTVTVTIEGSNDGTVFGAPSAANALDTTKDAMYVTETISATGDTCFRFLNFPRCQRYRLKFSGSADFDHVSICKR